MYMKRTIVLVLTLFCIALPASTQEVDFSVDLAALHEAAATGDDSNIPFGRLFVLDGDVGSVSLVSDSEADFYAEVELISGRWEGDEEIELHRAIIIFDDYRFSELFLQDSPDKLELGQYILVLSDYLGLGNDYDAEHLVPVIDVVDIRILY